MRYIVAMGLVLLATPARADSNLVQWDQLTGASATETRIERADASGNKCSSFVEIATVPFGTTRYLDSNAPNGFVCYRARNVAIIDPGDGSPTLTKFSLYSNVDSSKPGNPRNLQVP